MRIIETLKDEPVLVRTGLIILATLLAVFGFDPSPEMLAAITTLVASVAGVTARSKVTPTGRPLPVGFPDVDLDELLAEVNTPEVMQTDEGAS